jgi:hypothetical protein
MKMIGRGCNYHKSFSAFQTSAPSSSRATIPPKPTVPPKDPLLLVIEAMKRENAELNLAHQRPSPTQNVPSTSTAPAHPELRSSFEEWRRGLEFETPGLCDCGGKLVTTAHVASRCPLDGSYLACEHMFYCLQFDPPPCCEMEQPGSDDESD